MSTGRPSRPETIFQPGDLLNNTYRIEEILGRGGTSEVYRARSEISGRVVALKALRWEFARNEDYLALMTREEDVREIRHDGIVRYFDTQRTDDGTVYLVMDHVEGPGLDTLLRDGGVSAADLLVIAERVADALAAAHARNIVHRDLSPDNIILRHGRPEEAVIIDFGIAKETDAAESLELGLRGLGGVTRAGGIPGKRRYLAPERCAGEPAITASDIYSLGIVLAQLLGASVPEEGATLAGATHPVSAHRPCDLRLEAIVRRSLAADPADRYASAAAMADDLRDAAATLGPVDLSRWLRDFFPERWRALQALVTLHDPAPREVAELLALAHPERLDDTSMEERRASTTSSVTP